MSEPTHRKRKTRETMARLVSLGWVRVVTKSGEWWQEPGTGHPFRIATARRISEREPCPRFHMALDNGIYPCPCVRYKGHRGVCRCQHREEIPSISGGDPT